MSVNKIGHLTSNAQSTVDGNIGFIVKNISQHFMVEQTVNT